jgi:hypothetical protein
MKIAVEPIFARVVTRLDFDQSNVESGVAVVGKFESPGHMNRADRPIGC